MDSQFRATLSPCVPVRSYRLYLGPLSGPRYPERYPPNGGPGTLSTVSESARRRGEMTGKRAMV